jgi:hypothetical protein
MFTPWRGADRWCLQIIRMGPGVGPLRGLLEHFRGPLSSSFPTMTERARKHAAEVRLGHWAQRLPAASWNSRACGKRQYVTDWRETRAVSSSGFAN